MSTFTFVMVGSVIIIAIVIGITIWSTNKAYEVLPTASKVDPLPDEKSNEGSQNKQSTGF